jgi:hypothetical protein
MTTDQKPASAVVTPAMRDIARVRRTFVSQKTIELALPLASTIQSIPNLCSLVAGGRLGSR